MGEKWLKREISVQNHQIKREGKKEMSENEKPYDKVLFGTDGSENSFRAAKRVIELEKAFDCEVVMFHAIAHDMPSQYISLSSHVAGGANLFPESRFPEGTRYKIVQEDYDEILENYAAQGKKLLDRTEQEFMSEGIDVESRLILEKEPEEYILDVVEKEGFDLVVLGCKGEHSKLQRLMGTVTTKTLNEAPCDVLVVR